MTSPAYAGVLKPVLSIAAALSVVEDGMTIMIGGFGGAGSPVELVHGLIDTGKRDLVVVNNNAGNGLNRPGFAGGSNFQVGWSHDEQDDEQVFT